MCPTRRPGCGLRRDGSADEYATRCAETITPACASAHGACSLLVCRTRRHRERWPTMRVTRRMSGRVTTTNVWRKSVRSRGRNAPVGLCVSQSGGSSRTHWISAGRAGVRHRRRGRRRRYQSHRPPVRLRTRQRRLDRRARRRKYRSYHRCSVSGRSWWCR